MTDIAPVSDDAPAAEAVVDAAPEADVFEDEKVESFDRAYVTKLRTEAAGYRTKAKASEAYDTAFSAYGDDERGFLLEIVAGIASGDAGTAKHLQDIAARILGDDGASEAAKTAAEAVVDDAPLTKAQVQTLLKEREDAADMEKRVATIKSTAEGLGYKQDTVDYDILLRTAQKNGGDLDKAHASLEANKQAHITAYLAAKAADAEGSPTPAGSGGPADESVKPKTFSDASDAFREILKAGRA
jgi:hypothetical protein